jgi:hypothetical protein
MLRSLSPYRLTGSGTISGVKFCSISRRRGSSHDGSRNDWPIPRSGLRVQLSPKTITTDKKRPNFP